MFDALLKRLTGEHSAEPLSPTDARMAMACLLVRVARTDDDYAEAEIATIDQLLSARYALDPEAARALRSEAEVLERKSPDTVRFTRLIKDAIPYEHRKAVARDLWRVVLADDQRDPQEDGFLRLVVNLIGVNDRDSGFARQDAARQRD